MAETIHCNLEDLGDVLADEADRYVADLRGRLTDGLTHIQVEMARQAPRRSGDFAASIEPYVGEPKASWQRGGGGGDAGAAEVEAEMKGWEPGQECGVATDAPQGRKLVFHAAKYTKKTPAGWVDTIVAQANRLMEDR